MTRLKGILVSRWGPIITGALVGIMAPLLVLAGNPGNMGICVVCFNRDIAGALGLHRAGVVQYLRPEIMGMVLGAFAAALVFKEYLPRSGSAPIIRFFLGLFSAIGALVFLGCPWRGYLRLAGGDWNAIPGLIGLIAGIGIGIVFLRQGYSLGRSRPMIKAAGVIMPALMLGLLALLLIRPEFAGRDADGKLLGPIFFSESGPGAAHAPILISLAAGLAIGFLAQRSRFCTIGAIRDLILVQDAHLLWGIVALVITATITNLALGMFKPGFESQPVAHTNALWNAGGMVLAGLAFTLAGGCPGRQLFMSGEGDADAGVFVLGMIVGAGVAHNFGMASSPAGPAAFGPIGVIVGLVFCIVVGLTAREGQA